MKQYLELLDRVLQEGKERSDPQGVGNISVFGNQMRFDLSDGFPLMTTKKVKFDFVAHELLWFLRGDSTVDYLKEHKVPIWDPWATKENCEMFGRKEGDLGPIYGPQWIHWKKRDGGEINQIKNLVEGLKKSPMSRRYIVTPWNPEDIDSVFVAPCHGYFHCLVIDGTLSLHMFQRSADVFIGVPYNIASYSLLLHMLCHVTGLKPGEFVHTTSDTHVYLNHIEQSKLQLTREPKALPTLWLNPDVKDIFDFTIDDMRVDGYDPHPFIAAPVGV